MSLRRTAGQNGRGDVRGTPAISGRPLTRLLARWADARRLDPGRAEAIRLAVRAAPVDLGFDWWWRLLDPDNGSVFRDTAARPVFADLIGPVLEPPIATGAWRRTVWPQDDAEYQPYLRLT